MATEGLNLYTSVYFGRHLYHNDIFEIASLIKIEGLLKFMFHFCLGGSKTIKITNATFGTWKITPLSQHKVLAG